MTSGKSCFVVLIRRHIIGASIRGTTWPASWWEDERSVILAARKDSRAQSRLLDNLVLPLVVFLNI